MDVWPEITVVPELISQILETDCLFVKFRYSRVVSPQYINRRPYTAKLCNKVELYSKKTETNLLI